MPNKLNEKIEEIIELVCRYNESDGKGYKDLVKTISTLIVSERKDAVEGFYKKVTTSYGEFREMSADDSKKALEEYLKDSTSQSTNGGKIE